MQLFQDKHNGEFFFLSDGVTPPASRAVESLGDFNITEVRGLRKAAQEFIDAQPLAPLPDLTALSDPQIISLFVSMRDRIDEVNDAAKARVSKMEASKEAVEADLLRRCNERGSDSFKAVGAGSVKRSITRRYAAGDWMTVYQFFLDEVDRLREEGQDARQVFAYTHKRLTTEALDQYVEQYQKTPPGVNATAGYKITVTRAK